MTGKSLHASLSEKLRRQIASGTFRPQERLPSIRKLGRETGLSVTTVVRALQSLEDEGLIEGRPRSGYIVRLAPATAISHANRLYLPLTPSLVGFASKVHQFQREVTNPRLIPLGRAIPPPDIVPERALATMIRSVLRLSPSYANDYQVPPGNVLLREQLAKRSLSWGCNLQPNDFVITVGCTEAVRLALTAIARPGETVAVESPAFFGTLQAISQAGLRPLEIATDAAGMDLDMLLQNLRRRRIRCIITAPSFSNPSGSLQNQAHREALVRLAQEADVPVIEIDLYGDLHHGETRPWAAKRYDTSGHVLHCGSFSKTVAPGFRTGWIVPGRYYDQVIAAQLTSTYATPSLLPAAIGLFLKEGGYDRYLRGARQLYRNRVAAMRAELLDHLPSACQVSDPKGGYLLWVKLPDSQDSWSVYREARRRGISVAPGELFSTTGLFSHYLRIHGGHEMTRRIRDAIHTLDAILLE